MTEPMALSAYYGLSICQSDCAGSVVLFARTAQTAYISLMEFDWHAVKSDKNLEERGFGFDFAAQIFFGRVLTTIDDREDYGEVRVKAIGEIDGLVIVVIYTDRDDVRWIISARLANRKERALWHA